MDNYSLLIKELRFKLGLTQKEMSDFLGVSFATLNRWENGHFNPTFKYKVKIMKIYFYINENNIQDLDIFNKRSKK